MHYNVNEGMQNTWSDRVRSITKLLTGRNWLAAVVGCLVVLWVGLLFAAINQSGPANPGTPSDLGKTKSAPAMTVAAASDTTTLKPPSTNNSGRTSTSTTIQAATAAPTTSKANAMPTTDSTPADVIGGRGADETTTPQSTPNTSTSTGGTATDVTTGLGLTVQTPLTPNPITVGLDLNSGLQVDLGL